MPNSSHFCYPATAFPFQLYYCVRKLLNKFTDSVLRLIMYYSRMVAKLTMINIYQPVVIRP